MINVFDSVDSMWLSTLNMIVQGGADLPSRDGPIREVLGWTGRLSNPHAHFLFNPVRKINPSYAAAELLWFLSGQRVVHSILPYAPSYARFCNEGELLVDENGNEPRPGAGIGTGTPGVVKKQNVMYAHGAYGYRLSRTFGGFTAVANIIRMLKTDPNSRQAVLTLYDPEMDMAKATSGDKKDIPCTLSLNFILRDNKLHLHATMRSNDIWMGLPHDVYAFTSIQMLIAECLGVDVGWYQHSAMSMHLYDRNKDKALEVLKASELMPHTHMVYGPHKELSEDKVSNIIALAVSLEAIYRRTPFVPGPNALGPLGVSSLLKHVVLQAALKWAPNKSAVIEHIPTPIMRRYMEKHWC